MTLIRFQENAATSECYVSFRYDADFVAQLKDLVPGRLRSYNTGTKVWTIPLDHVDRLRALATELGHEVEGVVPRPKPPPGAVDFLDEDKAAAEATASAILASIRPSMRGAVFRAMARELYPDLYGRKAR